MRLEPTLWRDKAWIVVPAILFFAGNLAYFLAGRAVDRSRTQSLENAKSSAAARFDAAERDRIRARTEADHIDDVRKAEKEFFGGRVGTLKESVADMVDDLHRVCEKAGPVPHEISYSVRDRPNVPLQEMTISFVVTGNYTTLRRLISGFESDRRWVVIRRVGLSRHGESVGEGEISLSLATYFFQPEKARGLAALASEKREK